MCKGDTKNNTGAVRQTLFRQNFKHIQKELMKTKKFPQLERKGNSLIGGSSSEKMVGRINKRWRKEQMHKLFVNFISPLFLFISFSQHELPCSIFNLDSQWSPDISFCLKKLITVTCRDLLGHPSKRGGVTF